VFTEDDTIFGVEIFENFTNDCTIPFYKRNDGVEFFNLVEMRSVGGVKLENMVNEC